MKCDLHVHTLHSGMGTVPVASRFCRESYNQPSAVYEKLKRTGMDLVTITDHDSIDAVESLRSHPDFFLSEEATCRMPSGTEVHVGIYDITEAQHMQTQRRRDDFLSLLAYLREQQLFFSVNNLFSGLTGRRDGSDYEWFESAFPAWEILNGAMPSRVNNRARELARNINKPVIAGSDSHAIYGVGSAYTSVSGARTKREFLDGVRAGRATVHGESGSWYKLTRDVLSICVDLCKETPWALPLAPLMMGVPLVTACNYVLDLTFSEHWFAKVVPGSKNGATCTAWEASV